MGKSFFYDAFISYSRKDAEFAKLLEQNLERFYPPKDLNVPQRHLKIFRDEKDMTGTEYYRAIEKHLNQSRKLIVICSPNAFQSKMVNDEIYRFNKENGADNIIPVLLRGFPNNLATTDQKDELAFPQELCNVKEMPLANIDYRDFEFKKHRTDKGVFQNAWYILLAEIYEKSRREIEEREKKRTIDYATCMVIATVLFISSLIVILEMPPLVYGISLFGLYGFISTAIPAILYIIKYQSVKGYSVATETPIQYSINLVSLLIGSGLIIISETPPLVYGISLFGILFFLYAGITGILLIIKYQTSIGFSVATETPIPYSTILVGLLIGSGLIIISETPPLVYGISLIGAFGFSFSLVPLIWLLLILMLFGKNYDNPIPIIIMPFGLLIGSALITISETPPLVYGISLIGALLIFFTIISWIYIIIRSGLYRKSFENPFLISFLTGGLIIGSSLVLLFKIPPLFYDLSAIGIFGFILTVVMVRRLWSNIRL